MTSRAQKRRSNETWFQARSLSVDMARSLLRCRRVHGALAVSFALPTVALIRCLGGIVNGRWTDTAHKSKRKLIMLKLKGTNAWKAAGVLLLLAVSIVVMLVGPALRKEPDGGPPADVPAMSNPPPPGSLHIEMP